MRKQVSTDKAPAAIGPYAQANIYNDLIFASGQIPIIPETGAIETGDIKAQTNQVFKNIKAILEEAGSGLDKVLKTTVFLKDMNDFVPMNEVYAEYFEGLPLPSRSAVQVAKLPKDVSVEIEVIAHL